MIVTGEALIEGSIHYHKDVRLSDALNSPYQRENPYVALNDARVLRLESGEEIMRVRFLMVSRSHIICIMPKSELISSGFLDAIQNRDATTPQAAMPAPPPPNPKDRRSSLRRKGSPTAVLITNAEATAPPFGGWVVERSRTGLGVVVDRLVGVGTRLCVRCRYGVPLGSGRCEELPPRQGECHARLPVRDQDRLGAVAQVRIMKETPER